MTVIDDAQAIASRWTTDLSLAKLIDEKLRHAQLPEGSIDVVALGKASREMAAAVRATMGDRCHRQIVVSDGTVPGEEGVLVGEHPIPGAKSLRAGQSVVTFLESANHADVTLFLMSGGASSLCVVPSPPLTLDDLGDIWQGALRVGVDITTLNKIRATSSLIAGGAVLRHVRSRHSASLVLVDNVVSGAQWVGSAMTYDYVPSSEEVEALWNAIGASATLRAKLGVAFANRTSLMSRRGGPSHQNLVVGEPAMMLNSAINEARRRGYDVVDMGARVVGDVEDVVREWGAILRSAVGRTALVGVGEVLVRVEGDGEGGRCQEFAWRMAKEISNEDRSRAVVARASDGRDFVEGVGGAWCTEATGARILELGLDWSSVARAHDTSPALRRLDQLIEGGHTGWNLCDLYVAVTD
jgi:glycerate 2-kinase